MPPGGNFRGRHPLLFSTAGQGNPADQIIDPLRNHRISAARISSRVLVGGECAAIQRR